MSNICRAVIRRLEAKRAEIQRDAERRSDNAQHYLANDLLNRACGVGEAIELIVSMEADADLPLTKFERECDMHCSYADRMIEDRISRENAVEAEE